MVTFLSESNQEFLIIEELKQQAKEFYKLSSNYKTEKFCNKDNRVG